jgi:hypothetical protein
LFTPPPVPQERAGKCKGGAGRLELYPRTFTEFSIKEINVVNNLL